MTFGEKLKEARLKLGMSQAAVADLAGTTGNTYGNWERDVSEPSFFDACCVAQVLGLSLNCLAGWED